MYSHVPLLDQHWRQPLRSQFLVHAQEVDLSHVDLLFKDLTGWPSGPISMDKDSQQDGAPQL